MTTDGITGTPFTQATIIQMDSGEESKQVTLFQGIEDKIVVVESVGINAFLQQGQELVPSIIPISDEGTTVYPIALPGSSSFSDPELPFRRFGSQQLLLYANKIEVSVTRSNTAGKAHIEFNISGRMLDQEPYIDTPVDLRDDG